MASNKKARYDTYETTTMSSSPFERLDQDAFQQVLLRTRAADHSALRLTCRRFQQTLDSPLFRNQRAVTEWAEVKAIPLTARENYEEAHDDDDDDPNDSSFFRENYSDLGYVAYPGVVRNDIRLIVDGKKAGRASFTLVNRRNTRDFHSACDAISSDLQATGCEFFDNKGRPRVASVQEAMARW